MDLLLLAHVYGLDVISTTTSYRYVCDVIWFALFSYISTKDNCEAGQVTN